MGRPNKSKKFEVGDCYRVINYNTEKSYDVEIKERSEKWATILINNELKKVRLYPVSNPFSESILMDDFSPIFSYNNLENHSIES